MDTTSILTIGITIASSLAIVSFGYGILNNKVQNNENNLKQFQKESKERDAQILATHEKDIKEIHEAQSQNNTIIQSINNSLASINTKLDLLFAGKIKTEEKA